MVSCPISEQPKATLLRASEAMPYRSLLPLLISAGLIIALPEASRLIVSFLVITIGTVVSLPVVNDQVSPSAVSVAFTERTRQKYVVEGMSESISYTGVVRLDAFSV